MTDLEAKLYYHLHCNHFPPYPTALIPLAQHAIELAALGMGDTKINLAEFGFDREGAITCTAGQIIEDLHLEEFIGGI